MSRQKPVEMFMPPNTLKSKIGGAMPALDEEAIKRAEAALDQLSGQFGEWLQSEVELLQEARNCLKSGELDAGKVDGFHTRAHDLKGQGTTYRFPLVTALAGSLCKLIEYLPEPNALPLQLVDAHVDAIRAVVRGNIQDPNDPLGVALLKELNVRVSDIIAEWSKNAEAN